MFRLGIYDLYHWKYWSFFDCGGKIVRQIFFAENVAFTKQTAFSFSWAVTDGEAPRCSACTFSVLFTLLGISLAFVSLFQFLNHTPFFKNFKIVDIYLLFYVNECLTCMYVCVPQAHGAKEV